MPSDTPSSVDAILKCIEEEKRFSCATEDETFEIFVEDYVPYVATAIHAGHNLRAELTPKIALSDFERWQEEDPCTDQFISEAPIRIYGLDSRYEYDLNRSPAECIYDEVWGKKVWKTPLSEEDRALSLREHADFYRVIQALIAKIEAKFGSCIVYDIHSYNPSKHKREVPLFNLGVEKIETQKFRGPIDGWLEELVKISIEGVDNKVAVNDVFHGRGYLLEYITKNFRNTLVLATEIKKVYCNEATGDEYPKIIDQLVVGLHHAIAQHAQRFSKKTLSAKC